MKSRRTPCILFTNTQFYQIFISGFWIFPVFPYTHPESIPDYCIKFSAYCKNWANFKVINPSSYYLCYLFRFVWITHAPLAARKFPDFLHYFIQWLFRNFHPIFLFLKLIIKSKSQIFCFCRTIIILFYYKKIHKQHSTKHAQNVILLHNNQLFFNNIL